MAGATVGDLHHLQLDQEGCHRVCAVTEAVHVAACAFTIESCILDISNETHNFYFKFGFFTESVNCLKNLEVQMLFLSSPFQSFVSVGILAIKTPQILVICPSVQKFLLPV